VVKGIVFRYRTGVPWRDLPGWFGPRQTVWKRHHRFATDGTWDKLLRVFQAEADEAGRVDWNVSVDSSIVPAHAHSAMAKRSAREDRTVLDKHTGAVWNDKNPPCCRDEPGDHALGRSRGALSTKIHAAVDGRGRPLAILLTPGQAGLGSVIPEPDDQKAHRKRIGTSGGRPVTYDRTAYRGRNVIERAFNGFKHWRGLATR